MKIATRIVVLVLVGFLVTLVVAAVAIIGMSRVAGELDEVTRQGFPMMRIVNQMTLDHLNQTVSFERALRLGDDPREGDSEENGFRNETETFHALDAGVKDRISRAVSLAQRSLRDAKSESNRAELRAILESLHKIGQMQGEYASAAQRTFFLFETTTGERTSVMFDTLESLQGKLTAAIDDLVDQVERYSNASAATALAKERTNLLMVAVVSAIGLILCVLLGLAMGRSITRPLAAITQTLGELVRGNTAVSVEIPGRVPETGAISVALWAFRDEIGERRRTVAALTESERRFHALAEVSPVGIFYTDLEGNCLYSNEETSRITGLTSAKMMGMRWTRAIHPDDRERVTAEWHACAAQGRPFRAEFRVERPDGSVTWVTGRSAAHGNPGARMSGFVATITDITEQKQAAERLLESARSRARLHEITVNPDLDLDEKIHHLLDLGCQTFRLSMGIASRIEGDVYTIEHIVGPEPLLPPGTILQLGETYCVHALRAKGPVGFHRAGKSGIRNHPCYRKFGLEAYIGAPVLVDGRAHGTLNFTAPGARDRPFDEHDLSLIELFAQWIGAELSRAHAERALRVSEERLKLALEGAQEGMWDWNVATGDTYFSPRWERMLGYEPGEIKPHVSAWETLVHPDDMPAVVAAVNAHLQGKTPVYETEHRVRTKTGDWIWILDRGTVVQRSAAGTPLRVVGTHSDITARKRAEDALRDSEERIRAVLENVVDGIITCDSRGVIESANPAAERIFGFDRGGLIGKNVSALAPEPHRSAHDGHLRRYLETGEAHVIGGGREVEGLRADGSVIPLELSVSELTVAGQRKFTGIIRDITERKQIERMKNEFVSTVSHELRTPLTSIRGSLGLIAGGAAGALPPKLGAMVDIALRNTQRLISLVNDILDLQRIEAGRMEFHIVAADIADIVEAALAANQGFAEVHGVEFTVAGQLPHVAVMADADRIGQVMANLLSNAAKFSPKGSAVEIAVARSDGQVRVSVADRGPGIPDTFRDRIFQRFSQADSADTRRAGGTGLGLNISKMIVERHNGRIGFDSQVGVGSTFYFELPVAQ